MRYYSGKQYKNKSQNDKKSGQKLKNIIQLVMIRHNVSEGDIKYW
jgi:hypothetical protein